MSVPVTLNNLERRDAMAQIFTEIYLIILVSFDLERTISAGCVEHRWGVTYF